MVDVVLVGYRIEPGKTAELRAWFEAVEDRRDETADLLEREGMLTESLFVREGDDGDELWWYQEAESLERVLEVYDAETGGLVEESRALFEAVLVGGLDEPVAVVEPALHAVGPGR